jgi:methylated-DNA-[protein]-cysteine S-methyltransferase
MEKFKIHSQQKSVKISITVFYKMGALKMTETFYTFDYDSPVGILEISGTAEAIYELNFTDKKQIENTLDDHHPDIFHECRSQLDEYFKGQRNNFSIRYVLEGTDFQKNVWNALTEIPYGKTGSYRDIAVAVNSEKAVRAVGSANGKNKISIIIPCHRIIGSNGKLTGYGGGLWRKEWLLKHEQEKAL